MQAAAPVEAPAAQLGTGAAPMEEDAVPSAVEDQSINQLTAGEVSTSAAAENVVAAAVEKAVDAGALLSHTLLWYISNHFIVTAQKIGLARSCLVTVMDTIIVADIVQ